MKQLIFTVAVCGAIMMANSVASAQSSHNKKHNRNNGNHSGQSHQGHSHGHQHQHSSNSSSNSNPEPWKNQGDVFGQPNGKPIGGDEPRGDGRVPVNPTIPVTGTPAGPPGYVFVDGRWVRTAVGANTQNANPGTPGGVRDHRDTDGPSPRDHRVRDPFGKSPALDSESGGVNVTGPTIPDLSNETHYGVGPGPNALFDFVFGFEGPINRNRDHRSVPNPNDRRLRR